MEKGEETNLQSCDRDLDETGDYSCLGVGDLALSLEFRDGLEEGWVLIREEIQDTSPDKTAGLRDSFHIETRDNTCMSTYS